PRSCTGERQHVRRLEGHVPLDLRARVDLGSERILLLRVLHLVEVGAECGRPRDERAAVELRGVQRRGETTARRESGCEGRLRARQRRLAVDAETLHATRRARVLRELGVDVVDAAAGALDGVVHPINDTVQRAGGSIDYVDAELPQDACAAGRVQRLGIDSEPSLTSAQTPFATGLSSSGRLTSALHTSKFYGRPLIAWTPAFGADLYEVQYSKKEYPFTPEVDPRSQVKGYMTFQTSDVLPLSGAGTWWYRVRGIDFNLPTGVQQMSWSDPEEIVVSKPVFKVSTGSGPGSKKF